MGKVGKALGFSMDYGESKNDQRSASAGLNEGDVSRVLGGKGMPKPSTSPEMDDSDSEPDSSVVKDDSASDPEVMAMAQFEKAASPKAKAAALKSFLEACGVISGSY